MPRLCGQVAGGQPELVPTISASQACLAIYHDVVGFEMDHVDLLGDLHQVTVDTYGAQHPLAPTPSIRIYYGLVGLLLTLEYGWSGARVRHLHRSMGKPASWWPKINAPDFRGHLTISHVANSGLKSMNPKGHRQALFESGLAVWTSWQSQHEIIKMFSMRFATLSSPN